MKDDKKQYIKKIRDEFCTCPANKNFVKHKDGEYIDFLENKLYNQHKEIEELKESLQQNDPLHVEGEIRKSEREELKKTHISRDEVEGIIKECVSEYDVYLNTLNFMAKNMQTKQTIEEKDKINKLCKFLINKITEELIQKIKSKGV